jgi:hypothetical protein
LARRTTPKSARAAAAAAELGAKAGRATGTIHTGFTTTVSTLSRHRPSLPQTARITASRPPTTACDHKQNGAGECRRRGGAQQCGGEKGNTAAYHGSSLRKKNEQILPSEIHAKNFLVSIQYHNELTKPSV